MEKIPVSAFLLLVALSHTLAKDTTVKPGAKKDTKEPQLKLPQTLSRGTSHILPGFQLFLIGKDLTLRAEICVDVFLYMFFLHLSKFTITSVFSRGFGSSLVSSI